MRHFYFGMQCSCGDSECRPFVMCSEAPAGKVLVVVRAHGSESAGYADQGKTREETASSVSSEIRRLLWWGSSKP